jgi:hypothetical protein
MFQEIRRIEQILINLNISQIEESEDSFGKLLQNTDKRFKGVYAESTQDFANADGISTPKTAGDPYNFLWTGDFLEGFQLNISNETVSLLSTGTGSGGKAAFFAGYKEIFGLTDESLMKVVNENLLPFFYSILETN